MTTKPNVFDSILEQQFNQELKKLNKETLWQVSLGNENIGFFDAKACLLYAPDTNPISLETLYKESANHAFWWLGDNKQGVIFDRQTQLLWTVVDKASEMTVQSATERLKGFKAASLTSWRLPSHAELKAFAMTDKNPWREGSAYRLFGQFSWLCAEGRTDTDSGYWGFIK